MAKKALGRDLRDLLSQARPSPLIVGLPTGAPSGQAGPRRDVERSESHRSPSVPPPSADSRTIPNAGTASVGPPSKTAPPFPGSTGSLPTSSAGATEAASPQRSRSPFVPPSGRGLSSRGPSASSRDWKRPRRGWVHFLVADLLLLGLAVYFAMATPWGRGWSYGIAGGMVVIALLVGLLIPFLGAPSRRPPRPPERIRPDRPRVHVQLTRL